MARKSMLRTAAAALGGLAAAAILLAVVFILNAEGGFTDTTAASPLGWTIPLVVGVLVGGLSWLLLAHKNERIVEQPPESFSCPSCGKGCLTTWRLCPYCGALLKPLPEQRKSA